MKLLVCSQGMCHSTMIATFILPSLINIQLMSCPVKGNIRTQGKTKITGFSRDLTLSVLLKFLDFHFNSNKRITRANQKLTWYL